MLIVVFIFISDLTIVRKKHIVRKKLMKDELCILIVDDLEVVHEPIEKFLRNFVFVEQRLVVTGAYNLTQAKRLLSKKIFDLVMLDGDVGNGWGYEIIPDISRHNSKVIIVSCSNHDGFNSKNIEMGAHGAVNKTWLYEWNDEKAEHRTRVGNQIRKLFIINEVE